MAPLLKNESIKEMDVLAIQEPARNQINETSYNPSLSRFHLVYCDNKEARTYFYINKRIDPDTQNVQYQGGNLCTLGIQLRETTLQIYNVYNPLSVSTVLRDSPSTLPALAEALDQDREYIVIGNFNLYYPRQNNPGRYIYYAIVDELFEIIEEYKIELRLPQGTVIW